MDTSLELYELGGHLTARENFQLFSGTTFFSANFKRLWSSPKTSPQNIIRQATYVTDDPENLLTVGRRFAAKQYGKQNRFLLDEDLVHKIIPAAIEHTKRGRRYYEGSLRGEDVYHRKSPHYVVLFQLLDHETRTAKEIFDEIDRWKTKPQSTETWEWVVGRRGKCSLAAIKRQLEDSVHPGKNDSNPVVERLRKGVYRLIPFQRKRVEWWRLCFDLYVDWKIACETTNLKLPRVGYRFFNPYEYDPRIGKYVKSPYADEYDQSTMAHPYNANAFYRKYPFFRKGSYDQYDADHVKVGEEEFYHGGATRRRIASQPKARRIPRQ